MLKTVEKVLLLQELEVFREATSEQLARLAIISTESSFVEKEILFERGHLRFSAAARRRKSPAGTSRKRVRS